MKVKEIIDKIYDEEYYCIYDDDTTKIVEVDKAENAKANGTDYDNWEVLDIEIANLLDKEIKGQRYRNFRCIMINCYNSQEA